MDVDTFLEHAISIHALRKESDEVLRAVPPLPSISIHALRKESDHCSSSSNR